MRISILIAITMILVTGCKKPGETKDSYTITAVVLDVDSNTPIANAKVYCGPLSVGATPNIDSAVSDVNGKVSFTFKNSGYYRQTNAQKTDYISSCVPRNYYPPPIPDIDRIDTVLLVKTSIVNIHLHKVNVYQPTDNISVSFTGCYLDGWVGNPDLFPQTMYEARANNGDTTFPVKIQYRNNYPKLYIRWYKWPNGGATSISTDSVNINQYGTKTYDLNY
jgi:hypothetical protein